MPAHKGPGRLKGEAGVAESHQSTQLMQGDVGRAEGGPGVGPVESDASRDFFRLGEEFLRGRAITAAAGRGHTAQEQQSNGGTYLPHGPGSGLKTPFW